MTYFRMVMIIAADAMYMGIPFDDYAPIYFVLVDLVCDFIASFAHDASPTHHITHTHTSSSAHLARYNRHLDQRRKPSFSKPGWSCLCLSMCDTLMVITPLFCSLAAPNLEAGRALGYSKVRGGYVMPCVRRAPTLCPDLRPAPQLDGN